MKKQLWILLLAAMLLGLLSATAAAAGSTAQSTEPTFRLSDALARAGDTVQLTLSMEQNPGIVVARLFVAYDADRLDLIGIENTGLLKGYQGKLDDTAYEANPAILYWDDSLSKENNEASGTLAVLTFRVLEDCAPGDIAVTLSYDADDVFDTDMDNVSFRAVNGTIAVDEHPCTVPEFTWAADLSGAVASVRCTDAGCAYRYSSPCALEWTAADGVITGTAVTDLGEKTECVQISARTDGKTVTVKLLPEKRVALNLFVVGYDADGRMAQCTVHSWDGTDLSAAVSGSTHRVFFLTGQYAPVTPCLTAK